MKTTNALLDRVKEVQKLRSDYALAKRLGLTQPAITNYRKGKSAPAPEVCALIAELLHQPPLEIIAMIEEEREAARDRPRPWVLDLWHRYSPRLLPAIATALIVAGGVTGRSAKWHSETPDPMRQSIHYAYRRLTKKKNSRTAKRRRPANRRRYVKQTKSA